MFTFILLVMYVLSSSVKNNSPHYKIEVEMLKNIVIYRNIKQNSNMFVRNKHLATRIIDVLASNAEKGKEIRVQGWIKSVRNMKENLFIDINDGSCSKNLQVMIEKKEKINLGFGSSIDVIGTTGLSPKGQVELRTKEFKLIGKCPLTDGYPYQPKKSYPPEYIRNDLHLRSRVSNMASIFRTRHQASMCFHNYLHNENFIQIHTPILTSNDCEGAGEVFTVKPANEKLLKTMTKENVPLEQGYFDRTAFLTVSGQLHLEAMAHGLSKVYTFGPTFRAENSKSPIHLSEFYMLELEECFVDSMDELTTRVETMIKDVTRNLQGSCENDILAVRNEKNIDFSWLEKEFSKISYAEAIKILIENRKKLKSPAVASEGLAKEHELFLVNHIGRPVFIVEWPKDLKSFYMRETKDDSNIVDAFDLLVPHVGELIGGSLRENDYDKLKNNLPNEEALKWYLDLRKYGSVPTAGFGLGFERYLQWILRVHNIKDVIPFPRWAHNCSM